MVTEALVGHGKLKEKETQVSPACILGRLPGLIGQVNSIYRAWLG